MKPAVKSAGMAPEFSYHLLRNALDRFQKSLDQLDAEEYRVVRRQANESFRLESLVLASGEARGVVIPPQQLDRSVDEVAARYADDEEFRQDLGMNGLDTAGLRQALYRELVFNSVMQKVAATSSAVSDLDIRLFYEMQRERFETPEQRVARHILVTVNSDFPENTPAAAQARMEQLADKLNGHSNRFGDFARRHSECPTAMDGGKLGTVKRGQLYPELDSALFQLQPGTISPVIESELGFHLLLCEQVTPRRVIPLKQVESQITGLLQERRRRNCQKTWLKRLQEAGQSIEPIEAG